MHGYKDVCNPDLASPSNRAWLPWLQTQLIARGILTQTPEFPAPWAPLYEIWAKELERYDLGENTILIGHSAGGGFLLKWLRRHPKVKLQTVILVAPWLDPDKDFQKRGAPDFVAPEDLDPKITGRAQKFVVFESDNDIETIQKSAKILRAKIPNLDVREFHGYDHFNKIDEFPELLDEILAE
jgi:predicted alpha/beta hydrolase family esterase